MTVPDLEIDSIGPVTVVWPRLRCWVCGQPVAQHHGAADLLVDGRPACLRCYLAAQSVGDVAKVRRLIRASP